MKYSRNIFSGDSYAPFYHVFLEVDDISKPLSAEQRNMVNCMFSIYHLYKMKFGMYMYVLLAKTNFQGWELQHIENVGVS